MKVDRKELRKFTYVSKTHSFNMGVASIERVTSDEIPDWKVYQFEHKTTIRTETTDYEGYIETTTTVVKDFPSYSLALAEIAKIENSHSEDDYRTMLEPKRGPAIAVEVQQTPINTRNHKDSH